MDITISKQNKGVVGIVGHVGVGHAHSHMGFVQDDSGGLAVVTSMLKKALPIDTLVSHVACDIALGTITVTTTGGGRATTSPRRGITPAEADLMQAAIGQDAIFSQSLAVRTFGRMYGQGVHETAVSFQAALSLAVIDTFVHHYPQHCRVVKEDLPGNHGRILGTVINIAGIPTSLLAVVNASVGGIGPNEDLEGNIMSNAKGQLMKDLSLDHIPTVVVEGKMFVPSIASSITAPTFWVRAQENVDNTTVAHCLVAAANELGIPCQLSLDALPQSKDSLRQSTYNLGQRIAQLGQRLSNAELAADKVALVADLATIVSQDAGGVTFMSNSLHEIVRGVGLLPGTAAVLSLLVSSAYVNWWKIPLFTPDDANKYISIITNAILKLSKI
ncbi:MAG: hypothetical protein GX489_01240 [Firmicutes bacterium]|jgi:hypothetical protein|nr:hypothetical protein [Bacillota bacterium]